MSEFTFIELISKVLLKSPDFLRSTLKILRGLSWRLLNRRVPINQDKFTALIIGNGPSASIYLQTIEPVEDVDVWCVNGFALSEEFKSIRPSNYVFADPAYWEDANHSDLDEYVQRVFVRINSETYWPMTIHLPFIARKKNRLSEISNHHIKIRYFNNSHIEGCGVSFRNWMYRNELAMPVPQNVLIPTIFLAILLRYQRIDIIGADHSWHRDIRVINSQLMLIDRHFYGEDELIKPFQKADGTIWRIAEIFSIWALVHRQYNLLNIFAESLNIKIVNRTPDSFIDAFESQPYRF